MTATFAELTFSAFFLILMNVGMILALLPEEKGRRTMRAIVMLIDSVVAWSFPHNVDGQPASRSEPIIPVSQPAMSVAS